MHNHIPFTSDEDVAVIARGLLDRTLPRSEWTHAAHFAAALWLLANHTESEAFALMPPTIRAYNEATGTANTDSSGYHETITQASLRAASHFLQAHRTQPLFVTCNQLLSSPLGARDWLLAYWSRDRLFSIEARKQWLDPDLHPFLF